MKIADKISLRMRITLLSGAILIICSVILTLGAYYNARLQFNEETLTSGTLTVVPGKVFPNETDAIFPVTTAPTLTAARKQFDMTSIIILAIVSVLGMGMVYIVAGRSLRPIHELSKTISSMTESDLQYRITDEKRNDEVGILRRSFNVMLDRLEMSFLRQKRFSANVAHELKTPLATINAGIQVLNLEENPSILDYKETLATTERNVKRLMAVVDDLLRLCDEQKKFDMEAIAIRDMFESICNELRPLLEEKHIKTEINCQVQTICGNPSLLYRACFNLIENAAKYSKDGGKITVEVKTEDGIGKIKITDTGSGIPKDEIQHIFEPFYRVNKSRSRKTGGAGLGLSIVKTIIEKHGWKIDVDSVLEVGSVFTITFTI